MKTFKYLFVASVGLLFLWNLFFFYLTFVLAGMFYNVLSTEIQSAYEPLKQASINKLAEEVAAALPPNGHVNRLAVLEIKGDKGGIKKGLISSLVEGTGFTVIEREDVELLLEEQGLQLNDIMDEDFTVKQGRIKGVQGVLIGSALKEDYGIGIYKMRVHLKLDDVESAEVIFSRDFYVSAVAPWRNTVIFSGNLLIVIVLLLLLQQMRVVRIKELKIKQSLSVRLGYAKELSNVISNLSDARERLANVSNIELSVDLMDVERGVQLFKDAIVNAPRGDIDMRTRREFSQAVRFDRKTDRHIKSIVKASDRICSRVLSGKHSKLACELDSLRSIVNNASCRLKSRLF